MKRAAAMILAVLMMIQLLPVQAETYSDWFQVETQETPVYHTVRFVADGEEIASVSVADGSSLSSVPEAPEKSGFVFTGPGEVCPHGYLPEFSGKDDQHRPPADRFDLF